MEDKSVPVPPVPPQISYITAQKNAVLKIIAVYGETDASRKQSLRMFHARFEVRTAMLLKISFF
jgi:hypothetical protein